MLCLGLSSIQRDILEANVQIGRGGWRQPPRLIQELVKVSDQQTEEQQAAFLVAFAEKAIVGPAAQAAGVTRAEVEEWLKAPAFQARYDAAYAAYREMLMRIAVERGLYRWDEAKQRYVETPKGRRASARSRYGA